MRNIKKYNTSKLMLLSTILLLTHPIFANLTLDCVHVANVGQGNGVSMRFHNNKTNGKVGVIIDAGSSESGHIENSGKSLREYQPIIGAQNYDHSSYSNMHPTQGADRILQPFINGNNLNNLDIEHLFIILSHPDKDHYSYISSVLSKIRHNHPNLPITALLGGSWWYKEGHGVVQELYKHNSIIILPADKKVIRGINADQSIRGFPRIKEIDIYDFDDEISNAPNEPIYLNDYFNQIRNMSSIDFRIPNNENIPPLFIWSLDRNNGNYHNTNAQSMVVSYTDYDNFNASFIFAGDAPDARFQALAKYIKNNDNDDTNDIFRTNQPLINNLLRQSPTQTEAENHNVWLMLPHHGSDEDISNTALRMFAPSGYIVSAGKGGMYSHPGIKTIKNIVKHQNSHKWNLHTPILLTMFESQITGEKRKKENIISKTAVIDSSQNHLILSTYNLGNILFENNNISVEKTEQPQIGMPKLNDILHKSAMKKDISSRKTQKRLNKLILEKNIKRKNKSKFARNISTRKATKK